MNNLRILFRGFLRPVFLLAVAAVLMIFLIFGDRNVLGSLFSSGERGPQKFAILAINDVYRIAGSDRGVAGGMARVRALRSEVERQYPDLLMLHAGDFLSPSFLGNTYKGEQMVHLMNLLDGDPQANTPDNRLFATFGNHEFDDTNCATDKDGPLADLVRMSEFTWLAGNLKFEQAGAGCKNLAGVAGAANIIGNRIVMSGGLRVGLYGMILPEKEYLPVMETVPAPNDVDDADLYSLQMISCRHVLDLRNRRADVIVALTHLTIEQDQALLGLKPDSAAIEEPPCDAFPDLIVGGHDHHYMAVPERNPLIFKADSDALSANVITVEKKTDGMLGIKHKRIGLDETRPSDPLMKLATDLWLLRHDEQFCARRQKDEGLLDSEVLGGKCLKEVLATLGSEVRMEELTNRNGEGGFTDWIADQVRVASGVDVVIFNSGGFRLNDNLAAGKEFTRRHLEEMLPFGGTLVVRELPARQVFEALRYGVSQRGEGAWPHMSGLTVELGADNKSLKRAKLQQANGDIIALTSSTTGTVTVASTSYLMAGNDGYSFSPADCAGKADCKGQLESDTRWPGGAGPSSITAFLKARLLSVSGPLAIDPDKRVCMHGDTGCLIDEWS